MEPIYIKVNKADLQLMSDKPATAVPSGETVGEWVAFSREVYDGVVKELKIPTNCQTHTALRQKLADALRFEEDTVKISIAAASDHLNQDIAKELSQIFRNVEHSCYLVREEQRKKVTAVTVWFQDIFYGRKPQDPDRGATFKFLEKLGFGLADGGEKLPEKYLAH